MIAPIHVGTGAVIGQAFGGRWQRWLVALPLAFFSHQILDFANPYILHNMSYGLDLWLGIPGTIGISAVVIKPWQNWRSLRAWHWRHVPAMVVAMSPDIIDWMILRPLGQGNPIHTFFWSKHWLNPWLAGVWLVLAMVNMGYLLYSSRRYSRGSSFQSRDRRTPVGSRRETG